MKPVSTVRQETELTAKVTARRIVKKNVLGFSKKRRSFQIENFSTTNRNPSTGSLLLSSPRSKPSPPEMTSVG